MFILSRMRLRSIYTQGTSLNSTHWTLGSWGAPWRALIRERAPPGGQGLGAQARMGSERTIYIYIWECAFDCIWLYYYIRVEYRGRADRSFLNKRAHHDNVKRFPPQPWGGGGHIFFGKLRYAVKIGMQRVCSRRRRATRRPRARRLRRARRFKL